MSGAPLRRGHLQQEILCNCRRANQRALRAREAVLLVVLSALACGARAGATLTVTAERTRVTMDEQIAITATVVSTKDLGKPAMPRLLPSDWYTLSHTSRNQQESRSVQIVNGKMTQTSEITYLFYYWLAPKKEGAFTFPALIFEHGDVVCKSKPFPVSVSRQPVEARPVSLVIRMSKKKLYVGEQGILTVEIRVKTGAQVDLNGQALNTIIEGIEETFGKIFSISRLFKNRVAQSNRQIDGQVYQVFGFSFSVVPLRAGNIVLPSIPFVYQELRRTQQRGRDPFDDFFGGNFFGTSVQRVPRTSHSNRVSVQVSPLPTAPPDFSGAVGSFSLDATVSRSTVPAGEAITLAVSLSGSTRPGNLGEIALPDMPEFEVFTPEKHTHVDTASRGISTRRRYKYLIIPREQGQKEIPVITWTYFDPTKGSYRGLSAGPIAISVSKGKGGRKKQTRYLTQEDIREVGHDIRYIKTPASLSFHSGEPYKNPIFYILYPIPFLLALFSLLYRLQATILKKDELVVRRNRAYRVARRALAGLITDRAKGGGDESFAGLAEIIEQYVSDRFGFAAAGRTHDEVRDILVERGVATQVVEDLVSLILLMDSIRFGGAGQDGTTVTAHVATARQLIGELEKSGKGT